jgi:hypothetical protein
VTEARGEPKEAERHIRLLSPSSPSTNNIMGGATSALRIDSGGASLRPQPKQLRPSDVLPRKTSLSTGDYLEALDTAQITAERYYPERALHWVFWRDEFIATVRQYWREDPAGCEAFLARRAARLECPAYRVGTNPRREPCTGMLKPGNCYSILGAGAGQNIRCSWCHGYRPARLTW